MINPNTFDLNLLRIFEALMKDGSVSVAADRLGLSQPAVSNALNRFRELLGDPLFVRTRNGMEPTALALNLRDPFQHSLATIRAALRQSLAFEPAVSDRTFTLIMVDVGEITFLPHLMATISAAAPSISLRVLELGREDYEDYLESGSADMAIGRVTLRDSFRSQQLITSPYVVILDSNHPSIDIAPDRTRSITYEAYLAARHIAVLPRGATGNPVDRALTRDAKERQVALSIPHTMVLSAILPGTGMIATVPETCVRALCSDGRLCSVTLPFDAEPSHVLLWWHKRHEEDAGHRWLRTLIASTPH
ncbi:LysR family transcriptional regulator [Roseiarcaceae bacterium H3SJ34-1]|uniref:LysR family transcriptional regulator n=1 Tax=Terripilifer ovatus TaxID=3032367 RepID=UPI003AB9A362|nr:LysR family transcriptional regulator [Roseiarcaceae bacterium H3SJ34-1]